MTRRAKQLAVVVAGLVALAVAGGVGAAVRYTIFTIAPTHYAQLSGTSVYCQNEVNKNNVFEHAFGCNVQGSYHPVANTYVLVVDQFGVAVGRWPATGSKVKTIRAFGHP